MDYAGRLTAHLPMATRLLLIKADGSVSVHSDDRAYKPLNWMSPPCWLIEDGDIWTVQNKAGEKLVITIAERIDEIGHDLGAEPGLQKDGVEAHLQELLAEHITTLGEGYTLVRREYPTAIGPVDILARVGDGGSVAVEIKPGGETVKARHWAVEIKRKATIDAVEQLTRYVELLNRDPLLKPVGGVLAAQSIAPQAKTLAEDRGFRCVVLDYDELRGIESDDLRLF